MNLIGLPSARGRRVDRVCRDSVGRRDTLVEGVGCSRSHPYGVVSRRRAVRCAGPGRTRFHGDLAFVSGSGLPLTYPLSPRPCCLPPFVAAAIAGVSSVLPVRQVANIDRRSSSRKESRYDGPGPRGPRRTRVTAMERPPWLRFEECRSRGPGEVVSSWVRPLRQDHLLSMMGALLRRPAARSASTNGHLDLGESRLPDPSAQFRLRLPGLQPAIGADGLETLPSSPNSRGSRGAKPEEGGQILTELARRATQLPAREAAAARSSASLSPRPCQRPGPDPCDEPRPTSTLHRPRDHADPAASRQERGGRRIVSHDQRIRDIADRVLWLEDGGSLKQWARRDPVCGMSVERVKPYRPNATAHLLLLPRGCRAEFLGELPAAAQPTS